MVIRQVQPCQRAFLGEAEARRERLAPLRQDMVARQIEGCQGMVLSHLVRLVVIVHYAIDARWRDGFLTLSSLAVKRLLDRCYIAERSHFSRHSLCIYAQDEFLTPLANASPVSAPRRFPFTFSSIKVLLRRSDSPKMGPALGMHTNSDLLAATRCGATITRGDHQMFIDIWLHFPASYSPEKRIAWLGSPLVTLLLQNEHNKSE